METAKKSLGQHFLIDKNIRNKIINLTNIRNKNVLEIGPGNGFLTEGILNKNPNKLVLIEKDKRLYSKLYKKYKLNEKIEIYNKDFIKCNLNEFQNFIIVSNLPYNITKKFLNKILISNVKIKSIIIMIQKEVAEKIDPKIKMMNKYKFLINLTSKYEFCFNVSPNVFIPKPKVNSSVIKIKKNNFNIDIKKLYNFIDKIFNKKRKIISNLINFNNLKDTKILYKRVENLTTDELKFLFSKF